MVPCVRGANLEILQQFGDADIPFVLIDGTISGDDLGRFSFVGSNGYQAMREMVRHLVKAGHQRIAYIRGLPGYTGEQRYLGFADEIRKQDLKLPPDYVKTIRREPIELQGRREIRELLSLDPRPTVRFLIDKIEGKELSERREFLPCNLIVRRSCRASAVS